MISRWRGYIWLCTYAAIGYWQTRNQVPSINICLLNKQVFTRRHSAWSCETQKMRPNIWISKFWPWVNMLEYRRNGILNAFSFIILSSLQLLSILGRVSVRLSSAEYTLYEKGAMVLIFTSLPKFHKTCSCNIHHLSPEIAVFREKCQGPQSLLRVFKRI